MNRNQKLFRGLAIIIVFGISQHCSCRQEHVSFDQLFPDSPYKQTLVLCMRLWSGLRAVQQSHLSRTDKLMIQKFLLCCLACLMDNIRVPNSHKKAYILALLFHVYKENKELLPIMLFKCNNTIVNSCHQNACCPNMTDPVESLYAIDK